MTMRKEKPAINRVSSKTFKTMHERFEIDHRENKEVIEFGDLSLQMREKMKIIPKIQATVFGKSVDKETNQILSEHGQDTIML